MKKIICFLLIFFLCCCSSDKVELTKKVEREEVVKVWCAQLFSDVDKTKVEERKKIILEKHESLLSGMPMNIVSSKIAGIGTFYRLQVGAFETRQMATNLCAKLKKQKQDCIPAK